MRAQARRHTSAFLTNALATLALMGCAEDPEPERAESVEAAVTAGMRTVSITAPEDGATVTNSDILITLSVEGLEIVPAGEDQPDSGHHHLIVNADLPPLDQPIPAVEGEYIHMGLAQTEYLLADLEPGEYRVIALVGDYLHVPLDPVVADTVRFTIN